MNTANSERDLKQSLRFLTGYGEMATLTREKDWSDSTLGPVESWPQSLLTTLNIILNSRFPMFLFWGTDLICFYNDAYRPSLGNHGKHPYILGMPAKESWSEIWETISPLIKEVMQGGGSVFNENQLIPIYRNGGLEDVYWTFSYSPVNDESGNVGGVLVTCNETTEIITSLKNLHAHEQQLHFTIDAANLGTWDLNPATNKFTGNDRLKSWFGLEPKDEIELDKALMAIAEKDRQKAIDAIQKAIAPGSDGAYEVEYTIINPLSKKEIIVVAKGRADFDENNIATRFSGTLEDITEKTKASLKLKESEHRFRNTVELAPVGITILRGTDFVVEMANEKYLELVDRPENTFVGRSIFDSLPEVKEVVNPLLTQVLTTGVPFQSEAFSVMLNRFGKQELGYFNLLYHPLEEDGVVTSIMVVATEVTNAVIARQRLAESELQFRNMVMQSPIPMTIVRGPKHIIEMANTTMFEDIWRKKEEEVLGKSIIDAFPELKEQKYEELLNKVFTSGKIYREIESVAYVQGNDGLKKFILDFEYAPLFEVDGSTSGLMITVNDVTEKVEARIAVENSEQRISTLIKTAPFPIGVYIGKEMIIEIANQTIIDIWGKGQDVIGKSYKEILPELEAQELFDQLNNVYETGVAFHAFDKKLLIEKEGRNEAYYFNYSLTPLFDTEGKVYGVMNTGANVTNLNIAKQKVEESEKRFRNVADSAPAFIWMSGLDKLFYYFNTAWLNFTGKSTEEESGYGWWEGIFPDDRQKSLEIYDAAFAKQEPFYMEYRLKGKDGEYRWISNSAVPRFTADGAFEGYIGACMDIHEQVIYHKKLKEDEARLNIVISASELGTWELDVTTNKVSYSERFLEIFNFQKDYNASHPDLVSRIHPEDMQVREEAFKVAYKTGQLQYTSRIIWSDNSIHWMETKGKVFYNEENKPDKLIGTIRDITEEKNHELRLQEREQKFRLLADSMPQFVWTSGTDGVLDYFNQAVYDYSGLSVAQSQNNGWIEIVHPEEREENIRKWKHSLQTGEEFIFEHRFRRNEGEYRWQLSRAIPQRDENGVIQMWVGTSTDIQEQKMFTQELEKQVRLRTRELAQLNEELIKSEERYHLMVNEVQEYAILFLNNEGIIENWNKGAEKIKGYEASEIIGKSFSIFYTDQDKDAQLPQSLLHHARDFGKVMHEGMRIKKDGTLFWAHVVITAIHDAKKNVIGFSKVTHDLTDKKQAEEKMRHNSEQLADKNRELEKMNSELQSFAYISSHDLQEPLRKIQIFAARVLEKEVDNLSEKGKDYFKRMQQSANRMQTLIHDLLTYSRTNTTERIFVIKDLNDIVDEVRNDLAEKIAETNAVIEVQDLCEVSMIPFQFVQLMHNLLGNAMKFARKNIPPHIKISCHTVKGTDTGIDILFPQKSYCHIVVADNGIGFDDQFKERIFEVFQRLHEKGEYSGTGIGLAIVKKIAENHSGAITASSAPDEGARFDIYVPFH